MTIWRLVLREIAHRKLNFVLGLTSVVGAVACLVGAVTLLHAHDRRTEKLLDERHEAVKKAGAELEDAIRRSTIKMGFNVLIVPKDQDLQELNVEGYASKYMPEDNAAKLAKAGIVTINHLLPSITQKLEWPEQKRMIILIGTRGEVPIHNRSEKKPMLDAVPPGQMVVGYRLHESLGLKKGDKLRLLGKEFTVAKLHTERGPPDDSTVWINLKEAQELLDRKNLINVILALECHCAGERLPQIRQEIKGILPGTEVIERGAQAVSRAEARAKAATEAQETLEREQTSRADLRRQREKFAAVLVPLVMLGCAVWVGLLAFGNVRERRLEIGVLRALGVRTPQVFGLFLAKALLLGLLGAVIGYAAGWGIGLFAAEGTSGGDSPLSLFDLSRFGLVVLATPLLCGLASWLPAQLAAQQDPAVVLCEE